MRLASACRHLFPRETAGNVCVVTTLSPAHVPSSAGMPHHVLSLKESQQTNLILRIHIVGLFIKGIFWYMECIVRDVPIYYEAYGSGVPIIMIHGNTPDHRLMKGCLEPLFALRSGWQRIYFDLPGMGRTPGKEHIKGTDEVVLQQLWEEMMSAKVRFCLA
jgi:hypothetical protein